MLRSSAIKGTGCDADRPNHKLRNQDHRKRCDRIAGPRKHRSVGHSFPGPFQRCITCFIIHSLGPNSERAVYSLLVAYVKKKDPYP